ncbi:COMM domain-containing protein 4 [Blattella germanica]|nr:COMM domain-containing protein 4 [Blattella germanica]
MKMVCQLVVRPLIGEKIDYERITKLTADAKFEPGEVKACTAAIIFILATSARHGVDGETLSSELQQLGLPREHSLSLCRVYSDHLTSISDHLRKKSLRLSHLKDAQWRVDTVLMDDNTVVPELRLGLQLSEPLSEKQATVNLNIDAVQLKILLKGLLIL